MKYVFSYPKLFLLMLIRLYQKTLSFDHGFLRVFYPDGYCKYHPTCSEYGYTCIKRHGLVRGSVLTLWRVLRCNPFSSGGIDEPPSKK